MQHQTLSNTVTGKCILQSQSQLQSQSKTHTVIRPKRPASLSTNFIAKPASTKQIVISIAETTEDLDKVHCLVHDAYVAEGYTKPQQNGKLIYFNNIDQRNETQTLIAKYGDKVIGTVSITFDNDECIPIDSNFMPEYNKVRAQGRRIAVIWRLVVDKKFRQHASVVLKLIKQAINIGFAAKMNTIACILNQHHEGFYQRVLKMQVLARSNNLTCLSNLPASFMRLDKEICPNRWLITTPQPNRLVS